MTASLADILTAAKNLVVAINTQTQSNLMLAGQQVSANIATPTIVFTGAGRLVKVSIIAAGSGGSVCYDANRLTDLSAPLHTSIGSVGVYEIGIPFSNGLLVVPGSGQTVTVVYSAPPPVPSGP